MGRGGNGGSVLALFSQFNLWTEALEIQDKQGVNQEFVCVNLNVLISWAPPRFLVKISMKISLKKIAWSEGGC
jgi:hypothetical protein